MAVDDVSKITSEAEHRMKKAIQVLRDEFLTIRTGRASTTLVDRIDISYYGTKTPIKQLASISTPEPRLIIVKPYDKNTLPEIEKAIMQSELGITPSNDGNIIRLPIPQLTEERRKDLIKIVKNMAEDSRIAVRNIRRDANDHLKTQEKDKSLSEDYEHRAEEEMQKKTDKYVDEIDDMIKQKEEEIMEI